MNAPLTAELERYVEGKVAVGDFLSRDALVLEAVRLYRDLEQRRNRLKADIQAAVNESEEGLSEPLDLESIRRELELDESGRPREEPIVPGYYET
jgi:putative addiction module CopG family antidote